MRPCNQFEAGCGDLRSIDASGCRVIRNGYDHGLRYTAFGRRGDRVSRRRLWA